MPITGGGAEVATGADLTALQSQVNALQAQLNPPIDPNAPQIYSKLKIRRNLRAISAYPLQINPLVSPPPPPLTNIIPPSIVGHSVVGATLTCDAGSWSGDPVSYRFVWVRDDVIPTVDETVPNTQSNYILADGDIGHNISCLILANDVSNTSDIAHSNTSIGPILPSTTTPVNSTSPVISGSATAGSVLTCDAGLWAGNPTSYYYQWYRSDGSLVMQDTVSQPIDSYLISVLDIGSYIWCVTTAIDANGDNGDKAYSKFTGPIVAPPPPPPPPPQSPQPAPPTLTKEDLFNSFLSSNAVAQHDWDDAANISSDDPIFIEYRSAVLQALGMTDDELVAVLNNSLV